MTIPGSAVSGWRRLLVAGVMTAVGATGLVANTDRADPCGPHAVTSGGGVACLAIDEHADLAGAPGRDVLLGEVARRAAGPGVAYLDDPAAGDTEEPPLELVCDRTSSRRRIEVLYGHAPGAEDLEARRAELEGHVRFAQLQYDFSAFVAGSERAWVPRFVTEGTGEDCRIRITPVELSNAAMARLDIPYAELEQRGYADPERAYLLFVDDGPYCGMGTIETERTGPNSDHPDPDVNPNNARQRAAYTRIDEPCWGLAEAHELGHNLGAVQQSAPHSTMGAHCTDGYDAMCYDDGTAGSGGYNEKACPDELLYFALDCNGDDYYAPVPAPGSYLESHWNIVDNEWLLETFTDAVIVGLTVGPTGTRFDDVTLDDVFVRDIDDLARNRVTRGCNPPDNTRFCPTDQVTREQMAAFLTRLLDLDGGSGSFTDVGGDNPFRADIAALADAGITRGCNPPDNSQFCPRDPVTRGQMAAFLKRTGRLTE